MAGVQKKFNMRHAVGIKSKGGRSANEAPAGADTGQLHSEIIGGKRAKSSARAQQAVNSAADPTMDSRKVPDLGIPAAVNDPPGRNMQATGQQGRPSSINKGRSSANGLQNDTMELPKNETSADKKRKFRQLIRTGLVR